MHQQCTSQLGRVDTQRGAMSLESLNTPEMLVKCERVISIGTVVTSCGIAISAVVGLVTIFLVWPIDLRSVLVEIYMLFIALLLAIAALLQTPGVNPAQVAELLLGLFGFLRYWLGTGLLLIFAGALTFTGPGLVGQLTGAIALVWGGLCIAFWWWATKHPPEAQNEATLLDPAANPPAAG